MIGSIGGVDLWRRVVCFYLLLLFIVVPFTELALLLKLAEVTGVLHTLLLVIVTGLIGTWLTRSQGLQTYRKLQEALSAGKMPTDPLIDGVLILIAGALLLTPGILTDLFGFSLLIPFTRPFYRRWLIRNVKGRFTLKATFRGSVTGRSTDQQQSEVVDSYVVEHHPKADEAGDAR